MTAGSAEVTVVTPDAQWVGHQTLRSLAVLTSADPQVAVAQVGTPWVLLAEGPLERHAVKLLLERGEETAADAVVGGWSVAEAGHLSDLPALLDGPPRGTVLWRTALLADAPGDLRLPSRASAVRLLAAAARVATSTTPVLSRAAGSHDVVGELTVQKAIDDAVPASLRALRDERVMGFLIPRYLATATPAVLPALRAALAGRSLAPAEEWPPGLRVALYHLMAGADDEVRDGLLWAGPHAVLGAAIEARDGREYWACAHLLDGPEVGGRAARAWLDVTDAHVSLIPSTQRRPLHEVRPGPGLHVRTRGGDESPRLLVAALAHGGEAGRFRADAANWRPVTPTRLVRRLRADDSGVVVVEQAGTRAPLLAEPGLAVTLPVGGRRGWTGPDALRLRTGPDGVVVWTVVTHARLRRVAAFARRAWRRLPGIAALSDALRVAWQHTLPQALGRRGPAPRARVVFETESGRAATGDARGISEWLHEHRPDLPQAWIVRDDRDIAPRYAEAIERQSRRHHLTLNRSAFAVDDGSTSLWLDPPPRLRAVLTGPGIPVHRIGRDDPSLLVRGPAVRTLTRRYRRYAAALAPSAPAAAIITDALALPAPAEPVGLPRIERVQRLRRGGANLDLPGDRPAVLYLPTVRRPSREAVDPSLDLAEWASTWGERLYLLVHPHPQQPLRVPLHLRWAVRDLSSEPDLAPFLAAAALVVSDYSSLVGDAVLLDLPVVLHQPDRDLFLARTRGVYRGAGSPGPVTTTAVELDGEIAAWLADPVAWRQRFAPARAEFAEYWSRPIDGQATRRAVEVVLGGSS